MLEIYISGKITGLSPNVAEVNFMAAEILLKEDYKVINPYTIEHNHDKTWESYMLRCIQVLMPCDAIYMLSNWEDSKGAKIEKAIAEAMGKTVLYEAK